MAVSLAPPPPSLPPAYPVELAGTVPFPLGLFHSFSGVSQPAILHLAAHSGLYDFHSPAEASHVLVHCVGICFYALT